MKELKNLKELVETIHGLYTSYEDINLLIEMGYEDEDPAMVKELEEEIHTVCTAVGQREKDFRFRCWISWMAISQGLRQLLLR